MKNIHDTIAIIACALLFAASSIGLAQTGNDYVSTSELYEGRADIVAGVRVALEPGFHATAGSMVHAFIGTDDVPPSNGKFIIDNQTAMDEARAWQFAATAPGTIEFIKTSDGFEGYTAAYTVKTMSTGWVAKMLKEGQPIPRFNDGYKGTVINHPYKHLEKGKGYGLSYQYSWKTLLENKLRLVDSIVVSPQDLQYNRKKMLVSRSAPHILYSGGVDGNIIHPKGCKWFRKKVFQYYEFFGSYEILAENAAFYEDMFRIAFGHHIFVRGTIKEGKETGQWQYRYTYKDTDFLFMTANYKNGKLEGTAKFYKPDGRLYQEAEFEKGKLVLRIWYNEEGEIIYKDYYKNDKLIRTEQYAKDPRSF